MPLTFAGRLSTAIASALQLLPELAVAAAPVEPIASFQTEKEAQEHVQAGWSSGSMWRVRFTTTGASKRMGLRRKALTSVAMRPRVPGCGAAEAANDVGRSSGILRISSGEP